MAYDKFYQENTIRINLTFNDSAGNLIDADVVDPAAIDPVYKVKISAYDMMNHVDIPTGIGYEEGETPVIRTSTGLYYCYFTLPPVNPKDKYIELVLHVKYIYTDNDDNVIQTSFPKTIKIDY